MAPPVIDVTGKRHYRLVALRHDVGKRWIFQCDCGSIKSIPKGDVFSNKRKTIKSCGCLFHEHKYCNFGRKHGMAHTRFYHIWASILRRCNRSDAINYHIYGGAGVRVLWDNFDSFKSDMYELYQQHCTEHGERNTTIDRIDSRGHYCKQNCRWATYVVQNNNRPGYCIASRK